MMEHRILIKMALACFIYLFYINISYCQEEDAKIDKWLPQSPEVSSLGQFGTFPVSHFTGKPQISIPLYTLKEHDIEIPINLSYSGSGIKVSDFSTWVGLGWNLMPGGHITKINVGDETNEGVDNYLFFEQLMNKMFPDGDDGLFYHNTLQIDSDNQLFDEIDAGYFNDIVRGKHHQPDIFQFNFLGYSGSFYIDQDTKEAVILNKKDHIQIKPTPEILYTSGNTSWEVILPNGIKLYFDSDDHEKISAASAFVGYSTTFTWKLSKVLLINGEEINFTYADYSYNSISYVDIANEYGNTSPGSCAGCPPLLDHPNVTEAISITNNVNFLTKIESSGVTINFHLTTDEDKPRLDYLEIYHNSNDQVKQKYDFEYDSFNEKLTHTYPIVEEDIYTKYKLISLTESGIVDDVEQLKEPYIFEYYEDIGLPSYFSRSQDYWGYFNGINNSTLLPDVRNMLDGAALYLEDEIPSTFIAECTANRGPDRDNMLQGTLHKIIYPTKGSSIFNFEPHEFNFGINSTNVHLLTASEIQNGSSNGNTEPNIGAGLRIKEIINRDNDDSFISREKFIYEFPDQSTSGKLVEFFHYWQQEEMHYILHGQEVYYPYTNHCYFDMWYASSTNYQQISFYDNSVGYSRVEIIKSDSEVDHEDEILNGKSTYYFKNYSHFDEAGFQIIDFLAYQYCPTFNNPQNGLVEKIEYHDNTGVKTKEISYDYIRVNSLSFRGIKGKFSNHIAGEPPPRQSNWFVPQAYELYFYPMHSETWKIKKITELNNIVNGIGVRSETSYNYSNNDFNLLMKKTINTSESENTSKTTLYLYPFDYGGGGPEFITEMKTNNIMTKPIEIVDYLTKNSNVTIINGKITTYKTAPFLGQPDIVYNYESSVPVDLANFSFSNRYNSGIIPPDAYNSYFQLETSYKENLYYDRYDGSFNLLQFHNKDAEPTSFIWGYDYTLPVAKIEGADFISAIGLLTQSIQSLSGDALRAELNILRDGLEDALVTTYTYDPLVGLKSETDANNRTTYYEYDNLGRLKLIRDQDGNIVKRLEYNYKNP